MLSLEVQEGKNLMQNLPFTERYAKHTALVLRLAQNYLNKGHIVYGDSAFSSVSTATALLEHNTFYTGLVKQCSKGFPKQYLNTLAWQGNEARGSTKTVRLIVDINGHEKKVYGHAWNEPGRVGIPRKLLISTWNTTQETDGHVKDRWRINPQTRQTEHYNFTVPRTKMVKSYFNAASIIDVHNHLRQDGLGMENAIGTIDWRFRIFCTVLGFIEVDAYKLFTQCNQLQDDVEHREFIDVLTLQMLQNHYEGDVARRNMRRSPRNRQSNSSDSSSQGLRPSQEGHDLILVSDFHQRKHLPTSRGDVNRKLPRVRCKICRDSHGQGRKTIYCCDQCSENDPHKRPFGICGMAAGRRCINQHILQHNEQR